VGKGQTVDGVVERLRTRLLQRLRVEALILFGSRVEGEADEWSDYDFIVVSPDFEGIPFIERGRLMFPLRERGVSYDFLCYTPAEFEALRPEPTIVKDAAERGVALV
jgi:predicted nucleotidyltransferase